MKQKSFQRTPEDFTCEKCGEFVSGDGYTNHCPRCLYSKHVDRSPGDRAADCGGLMEPIEVESGRTMRLLHRCMICGHEQPNRLAAGDDMEAVIELMRISTRRDTRS